MENYLRSGIRVNIVAQGCPWCEVSMSVSENEFTEEDKLSILKATWPDECELIGDHYLKVLVLNQYEITRPAGSQNFMLESLFGVISSALGVINKAGDFFKAKPKKQTFDVYDAIRWLDREGVPYAEIQTDTLRVIIEHSYETWTAKQSETNRSEFHEISQVKQSIFEQYKRCEFNEVPITDYFAKNPEVIREALGELPHVGSSKNSIRRANEERFRETPGAPRLFLVTPEQGGEGLYPSFYKTCDGGWIFTTEPPGSSSPLTQFILLHEIGHARSADRGLPWLLTLGVGLISIVLILPVFVVMQGLTITVLCCILLCATSDANQRMIMQSFVDLNAEISADFFAIKRMGAAKSRILLALFNRKRDQAERGLDSSAGYVRYRTGVDNCDRMMNGKTVYDWPFGAYRTPFAFEVITPILLVILSRSEFQRFERPPFWVLAALGILSFVLVARQLAGVWTISDDTKRLRRANAPMCRYLPLPIPAGWIFESDGRMESAKVRSRME